MYSIPRKRSEIDVTIVAAEVPDGVVLRMRTYTPAEWSELLEREGFWRQLELLREGEQPTPEPRMTLPIGRLIADFPARVVGGHGFAVDGEPFDARNPEHVRSVPFEWQIQAMSEVVAYAIGTLPARVAKNSEAPAEPLQEALTPSAASTGESGN